MPSSAFDYIADQLRACGLAICTVNSNDADCSALAPLAAQLRERVLALGEQEMQLAGTGRQQDFQLNRDIRRDRIHWLSADNSAEQAWLGHMEALRVHLNRSLLLGLFSYEGHFAHYPPGAFYKKHLDAFRGQSNRVLTTVFYLNPDWQPENGGELLIYQDNDHDDLRSKVLPEMGTLVTFLSEDFPHEVLAAERDRYSIAGWFRLNNSLNGHIDPPR
ncbi:2OG-Fe(II) oxygenase [Oceanobacter mangrovi]|uniref:2OG-Fe(II) oxygenase n=1 Tax=Oceanobacter mangrovi TaxID=2862510 RepID=UPI001C8E34BB|nr:2OG-Fe(II) oxygenase [Oceanobacter mangrovi]